jgi:addiction module HigA family antidote
MLERFKKYKGIHPGIIIARELDKRSLRQSPFAQSVGIRRQTLNAIIKGKRDISVGLALKIENELKLEEGSIVILQSFYDIEKEKRKSEHLTPNLQLLRKSLFWDTDIKSIDWEKQSKAVIRRIFEKGNDTEKEEINRFYGQQKVIDTLKEKATVPMQLHNP